MGTGGRRADEGEEGDSSGHLFCFFNLCFLSHTLPVNRLNNSERRGKLSHNVGEQSWCASTGILCSTQIRPKHAAVQRQGTHL